MADLRKIGRAAREFFSGGSNKTKHGWTVNRRPGAPTPSHTPNGWSISRKTRQKPKAKPKDMGPGPYGVGWGP